MSDAPSGQADIARTLAEQWREVRKGLLEITEKLPESRVSRATERAGWTLRHELASLASIDQEVAHLLAAARSGAVTLDAVAIRRLRGEAMHAAQELRLAPLREHLADGGERAARAIEEAEAFLATSLSLAGKETTTVLEHVRAQLKRTSASIDVIGKHLD